MKTVTFNISIGVANEIDVEVDVSEKEYRLLKKYVKAYNDFEPDEEDEECVEFEDCDELSDLYQRVIDVAYDEMTVSTIDNDEDFIEEFCDGECDFQKVRETVVDHYDICVSWPELDEEDK